ncbi:hypothetical protein OY671_000847 [Metschnikowia pulcherrima]|nr:hypothetical protein OY671_000847 [Metschnikowia pulcherrima]
MASMSTDDTTRTAPLDAAAALDRADRLAGATRARGWRWVRLYSTGWAVASVGSVLAIGSGGRVGFVVGMAAWVAIVTVGATWAGRQGASAVGTRRRIAVGAVSWAVVYGAVLVAGSVRRPAARRGVAARPAGRGGDGVTTHRPTAGDGSAVDHHPRHTLDEVIHSPVRLSVVAALSGVEKADFRTSRDTIESSDSTSSKQLTVLEDAGYVEISKERAGRRTRTWVRLTPTGAAASRAHLDASRAIAEVASPPADA